MLFNFMITICALGLIFCNFRTQGQELERFFEKYVEKYSKNYSNMTKEYWIRFTNFKESLKRAEKRNEVALKTREPVKYGITKYSDLSAKEFQEKILHFEGPKNGLTPFKKRSLLYDKPSLRPKVIDWREYKAVTPVKNQKNCGACWAFSTVETMESMRSIQTNKPAAELSVQQVIDCAVGGKFGCNGGDTCGVLTWMNITKFLLTTEEKYPLTDVLGTCRSVTSDDDVQLATNYTCMKYVNNEDAMVDLLAYHGPIVAAVDATSWQDYLGGIIQYHCDSFLNHAVEIVGYNYTGEVPYYIVRNSWGPDFGINGYLHIAIGKNLCGIAEKVSALNVK